MAGRSFELATNATVAGLGIKRPEGVRRLGQALWMMIGERIDKPDLIWARGLLGTEGDAVLWAALCGSGALREPEFVLRPRQLAAFLCTLWDDDAGSELARNQLVWTLPTPLVVDGIARDGYVQAAVEVIDSATTALDLVAPYVEPKGMGWLHEPILSALRRAVTVRLITHDVQDLSSLTSASLEALRREAVGLPGTLTVWTARTSSEVLLHLKILVADERRAIVGSANVTAKGFAANLEAGVLMGGDAAVEISCVLQAALACGLVTLVYSNRRE